MRGFTDGGQGEERVAFFGNGACFVLHRDASNPRGDLGVHQRDELGEH